MSAAVMEQGIGGEVLLFPEASNAVADRQEYARSLSAFHAAGRLATRVTCEVGLSEHEAQAAYLEREIVTTLAEMLHKAKETADYADTYTYKTVDGCVVAQDGCTPHTHSFARGYEAARREAQSSKPMETEVERAGHDLTVSLTNDAMMQGKTTFNAHGGVSLAANTAIERDGALFWKKRIGYEKDLHFWQGFTRTNSGQLEASVVAIKAPMECVLQAAREHGVPLPEDVDDNEGLAHMLQLENAPPEHMHALGLSIRTRAYELAGISQQHRIGVEEVVGRQKELIRSMIKAVAEPIAEAVFTGSKTAAVQRFVGRLLSDNAGRLNPDMQSKMVRLINKERFDEQSGKTAVALFYYALAAAVEAAEQGEDNTVPLAPTHATPDISPPQTTGVSDMFMVDQLARHGTDGIQAGKNYSSSCRGSDEIAAGVMSGANQRDGSWQSKIELAEDAADEHGSLKFECQNGHTNFRKPHEIIPQCKVCKVDVSCKDDDTGADAEVISLVEWAVKKHQQSRAELQEAS